MTKRLFLILGAVTVCVFGVACGEDVPPPSTVDVELNDYTISATSYEAAAGDVTFNVRNVGVIEHELLVLRTDREGDDLPVVEGEVDTGEAGSVAGEVMGMDMSMDMDMDMGDGAMSDDGAMHDDDSAMHDDDSAMHDDDSAMSDDDGAMHDDDSAMSDDDGAMHDDDSAMSDDDDAMDMSGDPEAGAHDEHEIAPGGTAQGVFDLAPGSYVLLCNIATHYGLGMYVEFEVK